MSGRLRCPHCSSVVVPTLTATGTRTCPVCDNTGVILAVAQRDPSWRPAHEPPLSHRAKELAPGSTAALVLGVLALLLPFVGAILGILAQPHAKKARRFIVRNPLRYGGQGTAATGRILGILGIVLWSIVLLVVLFGGYGLAVLNSLNSKPNAEFVLLASDGPGGTLVVASATEKLSWSDLRFVGDLECVQSSTDAFVDEGDTLECKKDGRLTIVYAPTAVPFFDGIL
ncbi:MAG: hypothetical protein AABX89_01990 [Candidatus Thermoplasmatota archaeon]